MKSKARTYVLCVLFTLGVGALSAFLTRNSMDVYQAVNKPPLSPPSFVFPVVWTLLYILMGISFANVIVRAREEGIYLLPSVKLYLAQLAVNFFWSIIFFGLRAFVLSFVWLMLLWVLIIMMIDSFSRISKFAAYINIPYFLWVSFAAYLNFMIYRLN